MKVKFLPMNVEVEIKPGQSVLHAAQDHQIHIKSVCRGAPSCAECRVRVVEGDHNVIPPGSTELGLIGTAWFVDRRRLSCQLRCFGDITVDLSEQIEKADAGSGKKLRGRYNKDELQESRAVLGNLVMNDEPNPIALDDGESAPAANEHSDDGFDSDVDDDSEHEDSIGGSNENRGGTAAGQIPQGTGSPKKRRRRRGRRGKGRGSNGQQSQGGGAAGAKGQSGGGGSQGGGRGQRGRPQ